MGCDIHVYIETRVGDEPWQLDVHHEWISEDDYKYLRKVSATSRSYLMFARLAGVRGPGPDPRGLPVDATFDLYQAHGPIDKFADHHSASWNSIEEFSQIVKELKWEESSSTNAFYNWAELGYHDRPNDWTTVVNYCNKLINDHSIDSQILAPDRPPLQVRLVYWFDN